MKISSLSSTSPTILLILVSIFSTDASNSTVSPETRVIGGEYARQGEFPHQIMMLIPEHEITSFKLCGGSIISSNYILIAAHCVTKTYPYNIQIVAGRHEVTNYFEILSVDEVMIHPCYEQEDPNEGSMHFNDVAILKLTNHLPFNGFTIDSIEIDEENMANDMTSVKSIGWGRTHATDPLGASSDVLKKLDLTVTTTGCKGGALSKLITESQICTYNTEAFVCSGDSGGPLLCDKGYGRNVLCGIASMAATYDVTKPCHGPSIFTRVYHYRDWIRDVLLGEKYSVAGCVGDGDSSTGSTFQHSQIFTYGIYICLSIVFLSSCGIV